MPKARRFPKNKTPETCVSRLDFVWSRRLFTTNGCEKMGILDQTVEIYERLRRKRFRISIENGTVFLLRFLPEQYHHLAGFQHLRDLTNISHPATGAGRFYRDVKKGRISEDEILRSAQFGEIAERLQSFSYIEQILCAGQTKIIVSFDPQKAHSQIKADYMLYRRDGGFDAAVYCGLFCVP